jgi:hypothetical protein
MNVSGVPLSVVGLVFTHRSYRTSGTPLHFGCGCAALGKSKTPQIAISRFFSVSRVVHAIMTSLKDSREACQEVNCAEWGSLGGAQEVRFVRKEDVDPIQAGLDLWQQFWEQNRL